MIQSRVMKCGVIGYCDVDPNGNSYRRGLSLVELGLDLVVALYLRLSFS